MKIMIVGNKGQLGSDSEKVLAENYEIFAVDLPELDMTNLAAVETMVRDFVPDVILNCAAYTQVDRCEIEKQLAWDVNVKGPENLAVCARKYGGQLIHVSTDYVFDGMKKIPQPYMENDETHPLSYYGVTKLESEAVVQRAIDRHMILRTAWMYGIGGQNFLKTMLKLAVNNPGIEVKVVNDQYGSPTWSYRLALQILKLIENNGRRTYHATAEGHCTWYELAVYFLEKMDVPHRLVPCGSQEYPTPAVRPKNSILENRHLKEENLNVMKFWQQDIDEFVAGFKEQLLDEAMSE
ncbi:dTDP-4-dehydrorhamnose reductase [Thermodesulfobacteriota bacterium]